MERWSGKRVLITGGGGFVGLKLSQELIRRGYNVTALDIKFLYDKALAREEDDQITRVEVHGLFNTSRTDPHNELCHR